MKILQNMPLIGLMRFGTAIDYSFVAKSNIGRLLRGVCVYKATTLPNWTAEYEKKLFGQARLSADLTELVTKNGDNFSGEDQFHILEINEKKYRYVKDSARLSDPCYIYQVLIPWQHMFRGKIEDPKWSDIEGEQEALLQIVQVNDPSKYYGTINGWNGDGFKKWEAGF